jgi:hypothetical protein
MAAAESPCRPKSGKYKRDAILVLLAALAVIANNLYEPIKDG